MFLCLEIVVSVDIVESSYLIPFLQKFPEYICNCTCKISIVEDYGTPE
jgi:hypothetical protein